MREQLRHYMDVTMNSESAQYTTYVIHNLDEVACDMEYNPFSMTLIEY